MAAILLVCLLLEGVLFQWDALTSRGLSPAALPLEGAQIIREELPREENDVTAVMPSHAEEKPTYRTCVLLEGLALQDIRTAALEFTGETQLARVQVLLSDSAYQYGLASADTLWALPGQTAYARLTSHGTLRRVQVILETTDETAALTAVTLNAPVPYRFSLLRFAAMLLPAWGIAATLCLEAWRVLLDRKKTAHRAAYALTALACVLLVLAARYLCVPFDAARFPYTRALEYPFENSVYQYRSLTHAVLYDMLAKGRVAVDAQPDERLLALENPYDPTARLESGAEVMFDYALRDGAYYAYFGLTPVLVYYAPYRLVMGYLPAYTSAAVFFALLTVAAAFLCVWEAVRRFVRRASLPGVCLGAAAVALGSNLLMLQVSADRYHLSIACMQAFFFLTVWMGLVACRQQTRLRRSLCFALCAVLACLLVESRVTGALAAAGWLVPMFVLVLADGRRAAKQKALDAASFLAPLLLGAALVMAYNARRFGSPFEFGQTWQLTLEDIHYNRLRLQDVLPALYAYFLEGLRLTPEFPWFTLGSAGVNHTGNWFYGVANAGAFTMPVTWGLLGIWLLPDRHRRGKQAIYLTAVGVTVLLALLGYAAAGVAQRYVCDILPTLCLAGMLVMADVTGQDVQAGRGHSAALMLGLCGLTCLIACCLMFSNYRGFISLYAPEKYLTLYQLFTIR